MSTVKTRVLFLCTGNSCRSQMAEALLRQMAGDRFEAHSAGTEPRPIHPLTLKVLDEAGADTSVLRSKNLREYLGRKMFAYVVIVCESAGKTCPTIWPGVQHRLITSFEDPAEFIGSPAEQLDKFREVRDQIQAWLKEWIVQLESAQPALATR